MEAILQYSFREDPAYPVGLLSADLRRTYSSYGLWLAYAQARADGAAAPRAAAGPGGGGGGPPGAPALPGYGPGSGDDPWGACVGGVGTPRTRASR